MNKFWVEEHLGAKEAFVSNINADVVLIKGCELESLELGGLLDPTIVVLALLIELTVFFQHVLAYISVLFLDLDCDLVSVFRFKDFTASL